MGEWRDLLKDENMPKHERYKRIKQTACQIENKALRQEFLLKNKGSGSMGLTPRGNESTFSLYDSPKRGRDIGTPKILGRRAFGGGIGSDKHGKDALDLTMAVAEDNE